MGNNKNNKVIKFGRFRYAAAGAIAVMIVSLCFVKPNASGEAVYQDNFMAYEDMVSGELDLMLNTRSGGEDDEMTKALRELKKGLNFYNDNNYQEAIPYFETYTQNNPKARDHDDINFYLGVSYMGESQIEKGAATFEQLTNSKNNGIQQDAKWYLALAKAKQGDQEGAKALFVELKSSEKYGAKATKILNPAPRAAFR
jgi:tetratricopeptide (TPR) repeat protein